MKKARLDHETTRARLLAAALPHVTFDGWSEASFAAAATEAGLSLAEARLVAPRGAADLAADCHREGDRQMLARLAAADPGAMRFREKVAAAVRFRLQAAERETVRRGVAHYALPLNAAEGAALIWGTADAIWRALGDTSEDINWYSKRAILSGVYGATVLYWLGDDSPGQAATWEFLDRRIAEVMRFEAFKAKLRDNPSAMRLLAGPLWLARQVRAPAPAPADRPGRTGRPGLHR